MTSRTSQAVAVTRAEFARPHTEGGDPLAQRRLCAGMPPADVGRLRAHLEARTRFFDQQVLAAVARGIDQIVILGAGYDDRALRFPAPGVRYFELDHPATQSDKRRRLVEAGLEGAAVTLLPADFLSDDVAEVLHAGGHDRGRASLFVCEGVLVYFDQPATVGLLAQVRAAAGAGSMLAASLAVHPDDEDSAAVVAAANARRAHPGDEPWRTILPAAAQRALLAHAGWRTVGEEYDSERSLLATAVPA